MLFYKESETHYLKTTQLYSEYKEYKNIEVIYNDRNYKPYDIVVFQEYCPNSNTYSDKEVIATIEEVFKNLVGLEKGWIILKLINIKATNIGVYQHINKYYPCFDMVFETIREGYNLNENFTEKLVERFYENIQQVLEKSISLNEETIKLSDWFYNGKLNWSAKMTKEEFSKVAISPIDKEKPDNEAFYKILCGFTSHFNRFMNVSESNGDYIEENDDLEDIKDVELPCIYTPLFQMCHDLTEFWFRWGHVHFTVNNISFPQYFDVLNQRLVTKSIELYP